MPFPIKFSHFITHLEINKSTDLCIVFRLTWDIQSFFLNSLQWFQWLWFHYIAITIETDKRTIHWSICNFRCVLDESLCAWSVLHVQGYEFCLIKFLYNLFLDYHNFSNLSVFSAENFILLDIFSVIILR